MPEQATLPGPFIAARHYDALTNTPNWKDISPRAGVAWDIRGDGKTVARFNYGHYVASESVATATANNPVNTRINSATRSWTDPNLNYEPDCNLASTQANGECGALSVPIGIPNIVTRWDQGVLDAWGQRPSDDEILIGLQQQVGERLMLDVQWTRHWLGTCGHRVPGDPGERLRHLLCDGAERFPIARRGRQPDLRVRRHQAGVPRRDPG